MGLGGLFVTEPCVKHYSLLHRGLRLTTDFHSFHRRPKKEKRSKKERNGCYYYRSNSPFTPEGNTIRGSPSQVQEAEDENDDGVSFSQ